MWYIIIIKHHCEVITQNRVYSKSLKEHRTCLKKIKIVLNVILSGISVFCLFVIDLLFDLFICLFVFFFFVIVLNHSNIF